MTLQRKWKAVQSATNMFWSRWTREYLPMLAERKKWLLLNINLKRGDLVLLCDKRRIVETLPGPDNVARAVKVKTKDGSYVRSVASLALLECSNDQVGVA